MTVPLNPTALLHVASFMLSHYSRGSAVIHEQVHVQLVPSTWIAESCILVALKRGKLLGIAIRGHLGGVLRRLSSSAKREEWTCHALSMFFGSVVTAIGYRIAAFLASSFRAIETLGSFPFASCFSEYEMSLRG